MQVPPLARAAIDRDHATRGAEGALQAALAAASTRILVLASGLAPVRDAALVRLSRHEIPGADQLPHDAFCWLGRSAKADDEASGGIVLGLSIETPFDIPGATWCGLRDVGAELDAEDAGLFTQALALDVWHRDHTHSSSDGSRLRTTDAGWVHVDASGKEHFPRTDPAVIVLIRDVGDERILLGHNAAWPADRYSLIAGFVDPGESLEAAVVREVREETGLTVIEPRYVASQPWPFPRSLMLGFECVAANPAGAEPDGVEILDVRWFTRDEIRRGVVSLPGPTSIASWLIAGWLARAPR